MRLTRLKTAHAGFRYAAVADHAGAAAEESPVVTALQRVIDGSGVFTLVASDGISERIFYFAQGGVRVIRSGPRRSPTLGEVLLDLGKMTAEDLERAGALARKDRVLFGQACVSLGVVGEDAIDEAVRLKVSEELLELVLWDDAEIVLEAGQPSKSFYEGRFESSRVACDVPAFLREVVARIAKWREIVPRLPNGHEVYAATPAARAEVLDGPKAHLLELLDGTRSASDAIAQASLRRIPAYEFLLELVRDGRVRRVRELTADRVTRDALVREIESLEQALKLNADARIARQRIARALEAAGENSRAARQWRFLGDRHRRDGDFDRALECYRGAVRAMPTDFATRELVLEIHRHRRDHGQLVADGRPLADVFVRHGLLNRAKILLLALIGFAPEDVALRRQIVTVLVGLGDRGAALDQLRHLARILETRETPAAELRDVYVRILAIDGRDAAARDRLDTLSGAKLERRILKITIAATAAAILVAAARFGIEVAARQTVNEAIATARSQVQSGDLTAAKATLETAASSHPLASATATAADLVRQIEEHERAERQRATASGAPSESHAQEAASALERRARELADAGRAADANRAYRELFELYGDEKSVASILLPLEVRVLPRDATVRLAGEEKGQGSLTLRYSPRAKCTLAVECEGYAPSRTVLDGPQEAAVDVFLEKPTRWTWQADAPLDAAPLVAGGLVFVAGRDRCLTALSAADGSLQWRTPLGFEDDLAVQPVATPQGIFAATSVGDAVCVDRTTGDILWRRTLGVPVERQPIATADAVLVAAADGSLRALAAGDGATRWSLPAGTTIGEPAAVASGQMAYVDGRGGLVFASTTTGAALPGYAQPAVLRGSPVADPDRVWVMAEDSSLRVISAESRRAVQRIPVPGAGEIAPAICGDASYVVLADGTVQATLVTGKPLFRVKLDETASAAPSVAGGRVYVPGTKGHVFVLDARSGALLWRFDAKARVSATPLVAGGTLYVVTSAGRLFAVAE